MDNYAVFKFWFVWTTLHNSTTLSSKMQLKQQMLNINMSVDKTQEGMPPHTVK